MNYIYCYTNKINGHKYVGQTNDLRRRKNEHKSNSQNKDSSEYNHLFHKKLRQYGEDNFIFSILEIIDAPQEIVNQQEVYWIEQMKSFCGWGFGGYNMTTGGEGTGGINLYNESQVSKAKELIKAGLNYDDITKEVGISPGHLSNINLGKYYYDKNETYPLRKNYSSKDEVQEIIELLKNSDLSMKEIAKEKGRGYATIKKINYGILWHDENLNYPIRKESPQENRAQVIKEMLMSKCSNIEIIQTTGASAQTIRRINKGQSYYDENLQYPLR